MVGGVVLVELAGFRLLVLMVLVVLVAAMVW